MSQGQPLGNTALENSFQQGDLPEYKLAGQKAEGQGQGRAEGELGQRMPGQIPEGQ